MQCLLNFSLRDNSSPFHDSNPVTDSFCLKQIVRDEEDRLLMLSRDLLSQESSPEGRGLGIKVACRFVKKENGKLGPQADCFSDCVMSLGIGVLLLEEKTAMPEKDSSGGRSKLSIMNQGSRSRIVYPYKSAYE